MARRNRQVVPSAASDLYRSCRHRQGTPRRPDEKCGHHDHQPGEPELADRGQRLSLRLRHRDRGRALLLQESPVQAIQGSTSCPTHDQADHRPDRHAQLQRPHGPVGRVPAAGYGPAPRTLHHPVPQHLLHARQAQRRDHLLLQTTALCGGCDLPEDLGHHDLHEVYRPPENAGAGFHPVRGAAL